MSKISKILEAVGLAAPAPKIPEPVVPAVPAPTARDDAGAKVVIGSDAVKNQRVSGGTRKKSNTTDILANAGAGSAIRF